MGREPPAAPAALLAVARLALAGAENLAGKILIDLANPLDFSGGMPPTLTVCNTESLAERIQRAFPDTRVVKALNTMNRSIMVDPGRVPGEHHLFLCGDDAGARARVAEWLGEWFGWAPGQILDLGDLSAARGMEMVLPLWLRIWDAVGTPEFNFRIVRA
ncbi:MAG TPA: hypothetical protein VMK65_11700 [Longimicrobiales bacterium]|nr:hypothetical protein [Longimicrobiales bacterium]